MDESVILPEFDLEAFGNMIRSERTRRGLRQVDIYNRTGVAANTLNYIENAKTGCTVYTLFLIAEAMGCDLTIQFIDRGKNGQTPK